MYRVPYFNFSRCLRATSSLTFEMRPHKHTSSFWLCEARQSHLGKSWFLDLQFLWRTCFCGLFSGSRCRNIYSLFFCFIMYITNTLSTLLTQVTQKTSISYDENNKLDRKFKHGTNFIHTFYCTGYNQHTLQFGLCSSYEGRNEVVDDDCWWGLSRTAQRYGWSVERAGGWYTAPGVTGGFAGTWASLEKIIKRYERLTTSKTNCI